MAACSELLTTTARSISTTACNLGFDAVVIGGGHNGLVASAYLGRAGLKTAVFEKRNMLGGAAVTEEIVPGFKFSRASYLLSLLRPQIVSDLGLKKYGLKLHFRDPESFTPIVGSRDSLTLWNSDRKSLEEISKFSSKDAEVYQQYLSYMRHVAAAVDPLLDEAPFNPSQLKDALSRKQWSSVKSSLHSLVSLVKTGSKVSADLPSFWETLTAPASKLLDRWFESEPLKATLASDSVIGAMLSPHTPGSSYVLLHHVMGSLEGRHGAWAYVQGGMGAVSDAIARAAESAGVSLFTETAVKSILVDQGKAVGVVLEDGREVPCKVVLSNATPKVTFLDLLQQSEIPHDFREHIKSIDYSSGVTKINVALSGLPAFTSLPPAHPSKPHPQHQATIHLNCESMEAIHQAYVDAAVGLVPSHRPFVELTIPSSVDPTLAPPGCHVASLFTQYTPLTLPSGRWTQEDRDSYCDRVFDVVEEYAPGFRKLVIARDILVPQDLEEVFGLTGGNIFHGAMSLDQLYLSRPTASRWGTHSPIDSLYLCGSGAHPGGGVMGSCGWIGARAVLNHMNRT